MKFILSVIALTISLGLPTVSPIAAIDLPPIPGYGTPPGKAVKNWTRIAVIGDSNAPTPIVWVSPESFRRTGIERLIVLSPREYRGFVLFVRSYACSAQIGSYSNWGTLQVTQFSSGHSQVLCTFSRKKACGFLSDISALPGVAWTSRRVKPIHDLAVSIGCLA